MIVTINTSKFSLSQLQRAAGHRDAAAATPSRCHMYGELSSNQSLTVPQWSVLELTHHHHHHVTCHYWFTAVNVLKLTGSSQWAWRLMMQRNMLTERKVTTCLCVCACVHSSAAVCSCWINFWYILFWNDLKSRCQCGGWGWRSFQSPRVLHVIHKELWPAFCSLTLELSLTLSNMLAHLMPHPQCLYGTRISCIITQLLFRTGLWADRRLNRRRPGTPRVSCLCSHV